MRFISRLNQDTLLNDTHEPSDDLFGEDPSESTKPAEPEVKPNSASAAVEVTSQILDSEVVDSQPPSGEAPVAENSSGIAPVAQFIPSDAKLDQPTVSPDEPLATGEATVDKDTEMNDAPSQEVTSPATDFKSEPQVAEESQAASAPVESASSVPTPPAEKPELPNGKIDEHGTSAGGDDNVDKAAPSSHESSSAIAHGTSTPQIVEPVDQNMMDTPSSGTVRPRDDGDGGDEPLAKRARTAEPRDETSSEFKQPNVPAPSISQPAPAPTTANGTSTPASVTLNRPNFSTEPMKPAQKAVLIEKIKNTKKVKSAMFFLKPVDPVALNIPHYRTIITRPMDLGTMEKKLKNDNYPSVDAFVADFELMITNCLTFNGPQHPVSISGQNLRAYFMKQMETVPTGNMPIAVPKPVKKASPKPSAARRESRVPAVPGAARSPTEQNTYALLPSGTPMIRRDSSAGRPKRAVIPPNRDLPYQAKPKRKENQMGLKFCEHILEEFKKGKNIKLTSAFLTPVDPVALNIPTYFNVVKKPMDLQTMTNKLKTGQYATAMDFKADFDLMLDNCFAFNPPGNPVHDQGKTLEAALAHEWARKGAWIKNNTPKSQRASPASDVESDGEESEDDAGDADVDGNEATIAMLRQQLVNMQNTIASISGAKPPKAKKKKTSSGVVSKPVKKSSVAAAPKATLKAKPKKQRTVTYEEKQEISNATENMNDEQINRLTVIITENVSKYKAGRNLSHCQYENMLTCSRIWTPKMSNLKSTIFPMMSNTNSSATSAQSSLQRNQAMMATLLMMTTSLSAQLLAPPRRSTSP